jgi:hypothetical protein
MNVTSRTVSQPDGMFVVIFPGGAGQFACRPQDVDAIPILIRNAMAASAPLPDVITGPNPLLAVTRDRDRRMAEHYAESGSLRKTADAFGVSHQKVSTVVKAANVVKGNTP